MSIEWPLVVEVEALIALVASLAVFWATQAIGHRIRRADLVRSHTEDFYSHPELQAFFMRLERGEIKHVKMGSSDDAQLSELLDYLNTVGNSRARGGIRLSDIAGTTIGYITHRLWSSPAVMTYLRETLENDAQKGYPGPAFHHFFSLADDLSKIDLRRGHRWVDRDQRKLVANVARLHEQMRRGHLAAM